MVKKYDLIRYICIFILLILFFALLFYMPNNKIIKSYADYECRKDYLADCTGYRKITESDYGKKFGVDLEPYIYLKGASSMKENYRKYYYLYFSDNQYIRWQWDQYIPNGVLAQESFYIYFGYEFCIEYTFKGSTDYPVGYTGNKNCFYINNLEIVKLNDNSKFSEFILIKDKVKYDVTIDSNGGSFREGAVTSWNDKISLSQVDVNNLVNIVERDGYVPTGISLTPNGEPMDFSQYTNNLYLLTNDTTVYVVWSKLCNVTIDTSPTLSQNITWVDKIKIEETDIMSLSVNDYYSPDDRFICGLTLTKGSTEKIPIPYNLTDDITLYPVWDNLYWDVTINGMDGTLQEGFSNVLTNIKYLESSILTEINRMFKKHNYYIDNLSLTEGGEAILFDDDVYGMEDVYAFTNDITLYANWKFLGYTVTINANGGEIEGDNELIAMIDIDETQYQRILDRVSRQYYKAKGLSLTSNGSVLTFNPSYRLNSDVTLYVIWVKTAFDVFINANGGTPDVTLPMIEQITEDIVANLNNQITKDGYRIKGLSEKADGNIIKTYPYTISSAKTLYAIWEQCAFDVIIDANGGTPNITLSLKAEITEDDINNLNNQITKVGYKIKGLSETADGNIIESYPYAVTSAKTLYVIWEQIAFTVIIKANGGSNDVTLTLKSQLTQEDVDYVNTQMTREYWEVSGFAEKETGGAVQLPYKVRSDRTLYARWTRTSYKFTVDLGKGFINNSNVYIFDKVTQFTLDDYNYIKNNVVDSNGNALNLDHLVLDTVGDYIIDESHTFPIIIECDGNLTAKYNYNVLIDSNGGSGNITLVNKTKLTQEDLDYIKTQITKEHYIISGLAETVNGILINYDYKLNSDKTLYVQWGLQGYKITYELDGGTLAEDSPTVFFYDDRTIPNAPTKDGYKFKCWYYDAEFTQKVKGELKLENITLYALWKSDYYSVTIKNTILNTGKLFENTKTITQEMLDNLSISGRSNENGYTGTMSGYELKGISKTPNGQLVPIPYTIESDYYDVTLYAVWKEHDKYDVTILFNCDDINRKYEFLNRTINVNMIDIDVYISQLNEEIHQNNPEVTVLGLTKGYGSGNYIQHNYDVDKIQSLYCDLDIDGLCVTFRYKLNGEVKVMHLFTKYVTDNYLGAFPTDAEIREKYPDAMTSNQAVEGWYYDSSFTNKANSTDTITNNISIYLKTRSPYVVMITANANILQHNKRNTYPLYVLYSITDEILNEFISSQVNSNVNVLGLSETPNGSLITLPYDLSGNKTLYLITQNNEGYYTLTIDYSSLFDNNGAYPRFVAKVVNDIDFKAITGVPYGYEVDGYVFEGFYLDSSFTNKKTAESSITADMTIYAKWGYKYTVSIYGNPYSINGSDGEGIYTYNVSIITESDYNNWINSLNIVINKAIGVQIKHLSTSRNGNKINLPYDVENNINLYIVWEPLVLNITYELNGGSFGEETTVTSIEYGSTLYLNSIPNPVKENAKFYNWYIDSSFKTLYVDSVIKNNITLYAYYRDDINIKFVLDLGKFVNENQELNIKVPYGVLYKYEDIPELKENISKDFMGWYTAKPFDESNKYTTRVLTEDITLYARWERKWNVSFIIKDYSGIIGDIDVSRGCVPDLTSVYEQIEIESGKILDCWYIDEDYTTKYNNEPIEQNTSLYGRIVTIEKKDGHLVTFNIYEVDSDTNVVFKKTVSYCSTKYNANFWESQSGAEYQIHLKSLLKEIGYEGYNIYGYSFNMSLNDKSLFALNSGYNSLRVHFQYMSRMFPNDLYLIFTKYTLLDSVCDRVNLYLTKESSGINVNELSKDDVENQIDNNYYKNRVWNDEDKYSVDVNESKTFAEIFNPIVSQGKESITKFITYIIVLLVAVAMLWIIKSVLTSRKRRK